jgi:NAD(P)-dependent dehydrogenase (short-subunit alcohol dehydrogenase family)
MSTILVTGSNRGLGLEWVRQYAREGHRVYATCRHPSEAYELQKLGQEFAGVSIHRMDVTKVDELYAMSVEILEEPVDILISNAGIYLEKYRDVALGSLNYMDWMKTFEINALGPVRVVETFLPNVVRSSRRQVVVTSTHMASIADFAVPGAYYYRSTKAALNAVMEGLSHELEQQGVGLLIVHPGHVKTRMGGGGTTLMPPESVQGMKALVDQFTMQDTGRFIRYDGVEMPW